MVLGSRSSIIRDTYENPLEHRTEPELESWPHVLAQDAAMNHFCCCQNIWQEQRKLWLHLISLMEDEDERGERRYRAALSSSLYFLGF
ncbi:hypothetical protein Hanom_Chr13g01241031 [Helianthus anomalus]